MEVFTIPRQPLMISLGIRTSKFPGGCERRFAPQKWHRAGALERGGPSTEVSQEVSQLSCRGASRRVFPQEPDGRRRGCGAWLEGPPAPERGGGPARAGRKSVGPVWTLPCASLGKQVRRKGLRLRERLRHFRLGSFKEPVRISSGTFPGEVSREPS